MNANPLTLPIVIVLVAILIVALCIRRWRTLPFSKHAKWRRVTERILLSLIALLCVLLAGNTIFNAAALRYYRSIYPAPGKMYVINGHQMHLNCTGDGSPTIVLEAGGGADSLAWSKVQPELSKTTRVRSYDRTGMGWSSPGPSPRDADAIASELHALLQQAGVDGPIVLMGHSMRGMYIRAYATLYPQDVTGLIFVEGATPLEEDRESAELRAQTRALRADRLAAIRGWHAVLGADGATVTYLGTRVEKDAVFEVLRFSLPGSVVPFDVWIEERSHLPARYVESVSGVTTTTTLTQYQPFEGVLLPFVVYTVTTQGNPTEFTVQRIEPNPSELANRVSKPDSTVHDFSITGGSETTIPFDLIDNHIYLNVFLNGKGPYRFVFDTGAFNLIDPDVVREIGASAVGHQEGSGAGAAVAEVQFARVGSLKLGNAELQDQLFAVLPLRKGFAVAAGAPFDGLIGWEVLSRFVTSIDFGAKTVTLRREGVPQHGVVIPFVFRSTHPEFACTIDDVASQCLVDTGSGSALDLMRPFAAAHPSVVPADATASGMNAYGAGGGDIGRLGRLRSFELGGFTLHDLIARFSEATAGLAVQEGVGANVGSGVWSRFTVTFDYPRQTMTLAPNATFAKRDEYEHAGVYVVARNGQLIIVDVRPGTPAAKAGLQKDDVIATVDGKDASQITLGNLRTMLRGPAGTIVRFGVKRGSSSTVEISVRLADFI